MDFKEWVKSIQTAGYNGARTVTVNFVTQKLKSKHLSCLSFLCFILREWAHYMIVFVRIGHASSYRHKQRTRTLYELKAQNRPVPFLWARWLVDVFWCQPIKLNQIVSTSEFHEYWWNDIDFIFCCPLYLVQGLKSLVYGLLQKLSMKNFDQKFKFLIKNRYFIVLK